MAAQAITAGDADVIVAGGMESMSRTPYYLENARTGYRLWDGKLVDGMVHDGLWDIVNDYHMGFTADIQAKSFRSPGKNKTNSRTRVEPSSPSGRPGRETQEEILPIVVPGRKGEPRSWKQMKALARRTSRTWQG